MRPGPKPVWRYYNQGSMFRVSHDGIWAEFDDHGKPDTHADLVDISPSFDRRYGGGNYNVDAILDPFMCYGLKKRWPELFKKCKK